MEKEFGRRGPDLNGSPVVSKEAIGNKSSVGVAVLIVGLDPSRNGENELDPLIWTLTELKDKYDTDKTAGQISIPAETRKNGEDEERNVFGALGEFCDDTLFNNYVKKHIVKVDGNWYREKGVTITGERSVDVAVLIFDGALDLPLKPICPEEVAPNGWKKKSELAADPRLRDVFKQALELDDREHLIRKALEIYQKDSQKKMPVFPDTFTSMQRFSNAREFGIDMEVMRWDAREVGKRLPEAHRLITETIILLAEAQIREKRDYKREDGMVAELKGRLKAMEVADHAVGIAEVDGLELKTIAEMPSIWWERKSKKEREFYRRYCLKKDANVGLLASTIGNSVKKGWGYWLLERGDRLGYPEELGRDWYLIFHERQLGSDRVDSFGVASVNGIKALKLRPYDEHGM